MVVALKNQQLARARLLAWVWSLYATLDVIAMKCQYPQRAARAKPYRHNNAEIAGWEAPARLETPSALLAVFHWLGCCGIPAPCPML